jgi:hypothetical protein
VLKTLTGLLIDEAANEALPGIRAQSGRTGALFVINGEIVGLDLFAKPETYASLHAKLLASYALDALEAFRSRKSRRSPLKQAVEFLDAIQNMTGVQHASVSLGHDVRLTGSQMIGSALVCDGAVYHMCAFQKPSEGSRNGTPLARASRRRASLYGHD